MRTKTRPGFTLVELMFALAFVGMLLLATVATIIFVTNQYTKGVTLKAVNQAGRDLGTAMKRDAANVTAVANPLVQPTDAHAGRLGRLCLGAYSYVWSTADDLSNDTAPKYSTTDTPIVLARVADGGGSLCQIDSSTGDYPTVIQKNKTTAEMLPNDKGDYALRDISLRRIPQLGTAVSGEVLYDISYTIGTNQSGTINTLSGQCEPPSVANNNYNFCAVNKFELMVRAGY